MARVPHVPTVSDTDTKGEAKKGEKASSDGQGRKCSKGTSGTRLQRMRSTSSIARVPELPESIEQLPQILAKRFQLRARLGSGCFGDVYGGLDTQTNEEVAVKIEDVRIRPQSQLEHEADVMTLLQLKRREKVPQGFSQLHAYFKEGPLRCLVMDRLGCSLEEMLQLRGGKFTAATTMLIAQQVLHRLEYFHSKGLIHRDIKPENFCVGVGPKADLVYLIDFGLSDLYWLDAGHRPERSQLTLTGTPRYASLNAHRGLEQSRRDDLEACGHMFVYFLRGALPWSGLSAKTQEERCRKIMEKKLRISLTSLCKGIPMAFEILLRYARGLPYAACPDYDLIQQYFIDCLDKLSESEVVGSTAVSRFEWVNGEHLADPHPVLPRKLLRQPDSHLERIFNEPRDLTRDCQVHAEKLCREVDIVAVHDCSTGSSCVFRCGFCIGGLFVRRTKVSPRSDVGD